MFQPKYIHFVYSYVVYIAFASCLRREDQFVVFFSHEEHEYPKFKRFMVLSPLLFKLHITHLYCF